MNTESHRIEFKVQLTDSLEKEAVAFLNYRDGGVIYIGIDDQGVRIGVDDADGLQLTIKDRLKHNIRPSTIGGYSILHFPPFVLLYTLMYHYPFRLLNSLFILRGNKTRQRPCAQAYPWRVTCFRPGIIKQPFSNPLNFNQLELPEQCGISLD